MVSGPVLIVKSWIRVCSFNATRTAREIKKKKKNLATNIGNIFIDLELLPVPTSVVKNVKNLDHFTILPSQWFSYSVCQKKSCDSSKNGNEAVAAANSESEMCSQKAKCFAQRQRIKCHGALSSLIEGNEGYIGHCGKLLRLWNPTPQKSMHAFVAAFHTCLAIGPIQLFIFLPLKSSMDLLVLVKPPSKLSQVAATDTEG